MNDGLYYEFLANNNQLIILDYRLGTELFTVQENNNKFWIQKYLFRGQFSDGEGTWYVLDAVECEKPRRLCILKEKETWIRTMAEARLDMWSRSAEKGSRECI